ncbi:hypothetical protein [Paenibacillus soyae]|uniref:Uncharacterized protein n=1 Tax=Paenibacillus soyae TaxID=2969249 RepID=A0A9X2MPX9_9BACL|nr:hypothetical protein [Paenibacillus soyae]MCR2804270.1 hypothetical protein [Paenibacillus soyae]
MNRGLCLYDFGYKPDPGHVELTDSGNVVFYHYTREEHLDKILAPNSGLFARRQVDVCPNPPQEFKGYFLSEGFLETLPLWLTDSPYFGDLGIEMVRKYIGNILLRVELPFSFQGLFVADYAHVLEEKYFSSRGSTPLNLGYNCSSGREITQAYVNSYIPAKKYNSAHIAPLMQVIRRGEGIVIPSEYIALVSEQPLR